jgi:hypothetical protein
VNALANQEVGKYISEYFVSSFQKVGTFKIVNKQKQGGNVAAYFCAPDGRVLHVVAGPVNAATMLREARWVMETAKQAVKDAKGDGAKFKAIFRKAHAQRLRTEYGLAVDPVTYDPPDAEDKDGALSYRDPSGRPLAPKLPPPPINGPVVEFELKQERAAKAADARPILDRRGRRWVLGNQGRVHLLMAAHSLVKIEKVYGAVFENILGEKVSTKPVQIVSPFPWVERANAVRK